MDRDPGAGLYIRWHHFAQDSWLAAHWIHLEDDPVSLTLRFDNSGAAHAVECKRHGDDALQRVALLASRR